MSFAFLSLGLNAEKDNGICVLVFLGRAWIFML
jgi:hypothetical protein